MNAPEQHLVQDEVLAPAAHALLTAETTERVCVEWLAWLIDSVPDARGGFILLDNHANALVASAIQPPDLDPESLHVLVLQAITGRAPARRETVDGHEFAFPVLLADRVGAVVGLVLGKSDPPALIHASTTVQWGMGWLRSALGGAQELRLTQQLGRARQAIDLAMSVLAEPSFKLAGMTVTGLLAREFDSQMVHLGWLDGNAIKIATRSNTAWHDGRANLVRLAEQAMDEALDQAAPIALPAPDAAPFLATMAHEAYRRASTAGSLLSVPLRARGQLVGALMFERTQPFTAFELQSANALALMLAPMLDMQHTNDEGTLAHLRRKWTAFSLWFSGSRNLGWKLVAGVAALFLLITALLPVTYRVRAPSVVEGQTQRAAVAPFAGYIRSASARAGDIVKAGQVLARLEDKDLTLEKVRWESELEVALRKEREAMSGADRVALRLASAQAAQAQAQLDLVLEKLRRVDITAPFDGVVVKGDLSQALGSPVESGKVLFELAPLDAWRVILKVDERDIAWVREGQQGELVLSGLPGESFKLRTQRVLSVAAAEEGRTFFRVEADLGNEPSRMRPGMEGVAKVEVGEARLMWVWTHRLTEWLRRTVWEWSP